MRTFAPSHPLLFFAFLASSQMIDEKRLECVWPVSSGVKYLKATSWASVPPEIVDRIAQNKAAWQQLEPGWSALSMSLPHVLARINCDLETQIVVNEIYPGHWAWDPHLHSDKVPQATPRRHLKGQYEALAANDIEANAYICEYAGTVRVIPAGHRSSLSPSLPLLLPLIDVLLTAPRMPTLSRSSSPPTLTSDSGTASSL